MGERRVLTRPRSARLTTSLLAVTLLIGGAVCLATAASKPADPSGELPVVVVDERGAPVARVEVSGSYPENPGPTASFGCRSRSLGRKVTGNDGVAVLLHPPFTFRTEKKEEP